MATSPQVCPSRSLLTDNEVRALIAPVLLAWCGEEGQGPSRIALDIGCEEKTVRRARDRETSLKASTIFNMLARDGAALDPILAHFGRRSTAIEADCLDVASIPHEIAMCLPLLIELLRDGDCSEADTRKLDRAGVIDRLAEVADMLRARRERLKQEDARR